MLKCETKPHQIKIDLQRKWKDKAITTDQGGEKNRSSHILCKSRGGRRFFEVSFPGNATVPEFRMEERRTAIQGKKDLKISWKQEGGRGGVCRNFWGKGEEFRGEILAVDGFPIWEPI